jgi:hypothetical protein
MPYGHTSPQVTGPGNILAIKRDPRGRARLRPDHFRIGPAGRRRLFLTCGIRARACAWVSARTIGWHLRKVFTKLGIGSAATCTRRWNS